MKDLDVCRCLSSSAEHFFMIFWIKEGGKRKYAENSTHI